KPAAADPMNPMGGDLPGPGGKRFGAGLPPGTVPGSGGGLVGAVEGMTEYHKLVAERYFDVTPQARRIPVALVLIIDPAQMSRVEPAFANPPLRFLINQVIMHRYPRTVRPDYSGETVVADTGSGPSSSPMASMMQSYGGRYPGGPGRYSMMPGLPGP